MPWNVKQPDLKNNPLYLEPRITAAESQLAENTKQLGVVLDNYPIIAPEANDAGRIGRAIADAIANKLPLKLSAKTYTAKITLNNQNLKIIGAGRPFYDEVNNEFFEGTGTIIKGFIDCNEQKHIGITNLGIDARGQLGAGDDAALTSGNVLSMNPIYHDFDNIACIGDGYSADMSLNKHAILCQAGMNLNIKNIFMYNWYHGLALRAGNANVNNVYAYQCGFTSIIIKSASGGNDTVQHININNVITEGSPSNAYKKAGQIHVQSFNVGCLTQHINISNVQSINGGTACVLVEQVAGQCSNITVTNAKARNCGDANVRAAFDVVSATDVTFTNCHSVGAVGYAFRSNGQRIRVYAGHASASGVGDYTGAFDYLELNNSVLQAIFDNLNLDQNSVQRTMNNSMLLTGNATADVGVTEDMLTLIWTGASGTYTPLAIDIFIVSHVGGVSQTQKFRVSAMRDGTTIIKAAIFEDGTKVNSGTPLGSITLSLDTATANTLKVRILGNSYSMTYAYTANFVTDAAGRGLWKVQHAGV